MIAHSSAIGGDIRFGYNRFRVWAEVFAAYA
jgi:hypothetical protein